MRSPDTTAEAERIQFEAFRRLGPAGRVRRVFEMNERLRELAATGVRSRHPEYDDDQVRRAVIRIYLGEKLFCEVFPDDDIKP